MPADPNHACLNDRVPNPKQARNPVFHGSCFLKQEDTTFKIKLNLAPGSKFMDFLSFRPVMINPGFHSKNWRTAVLTLLALVAFAANSVFCRMALGQESIDAASFTSVRLVSGSVVLLLLVLSSFILTRSFFKWNCIVPFSRIFQFHLLLDNP